MINRKRNIDLSRGLAGLALAAAIIGVPAVSLAAAACEPPRNNKWTEWLRAQDAAGGHAFKCHVSKTPGNLAGRISGRGGHRGDTCQQVDTASSFTNASAFARATADTLRTNWRIVAGGRRELVLHGGAAETIGIIVSETNPGRGWSRCANARGYFCKPAKNWTVVLRNDGQGKCHLHTAYPS